MTIAPKNNGRTTQGSHDRLIFTNDGESVRAMAVHENMVRVQINSCDAGSGWHTSELDLKKREAIAFALQILQMAGASAEVTMHPDVAPRGRTMPWANFPDCDGTQEGVIVTCISPAECRVEPSGCKFIKLVPSVPYTRASRDGPLPTPDSEAERLAVWRDGPLFASLFEDKT